MITPIEEIESAILKFDNADRYFVKACEEYHNYEIQYKAPYIRLRKKIEPEKIYTVKLIDAEPDTHVKCDCPAYVKKRIRPCKHCFIGALHFLRRYLKETPLDQYQENIKCLILDEAQTLDGAPGIDPNKLREAYTAFAKEAFEKPQVVPTDQEHWEPTTVDQQEQQFKETMKALPKAEWNTKAEKAKEKAKKEGSEPMALERAEPAPPPVAFGGTVKDIPKNLVTTLYGKPYVTKAGLIFVASKMGLYKIDTEPMQWSWDNDEKRAVFKATISFKDGRKFSAFGVAIPTKENMKNEKIWPFVDHMAETRAVARALRNALAFGEPSVEEMADYEEVPE